MKIKSLRIVNYKSIKDSKKIQLHEKFNIFSGRNNSGKTAFLESLYKTATSNPVKGYISQSIATSQIELFILLNDLDKESLFDMDESQDVPEYLLVKCIVREGDVALSNVWEVNEKEEILFNIIEAYGNTFDINHNEQYSILRPVEFHNVLLGLLKNNLIYISSNRSVEQSFSTQPQVQLDIFASNIHTVLYTLRNNRAKVFEEVERLFKLIFNEVLRIHTRININQETNETITNIFIEFEDNSIIPLKECGSGYTQVLIFLIVIQNEMGKVILFDEPNTFLHPYAEKAIYDLVSTDKKHQYLFSSHSPLLVNYPTEKNIYFVKKVNSESVYAKIDTVQELLIDLGISNSDLAFADRIIFVEGETEENVLPIIFANNGFKQIGYNYIIINLKGTGSEFKKRTSMVNYSKKLEGIFNGIAQTPIPYIILLDKDERDLTKVKELEESYKGKIVVLPRREIENYFLNPEAIADLINDYDLEVRVTSDEITLLIEKFIKDIDNRRYYLRENKTDKVNDVKASKVLEDICEIYNITYDKIKDGLYLTEWLYKNGDVEGLNEVFGFFSEFLKKHNS